MAKIISFTQERILYEDPSKRFLCVRVYACVHVRQSLWGKPIEYTFFLLEKKEKKKRFAYISFRFHPVKDVHRKKQDPQHCVQSSPDISNSFLNN